VLPVELEDEQVAKEVILAGVTTAIKKAIGKMSVSNGRETCNGIQAEDI